MPDTIYEMYDAAMNMARKKGGFEPRKVAAKKGKGFYFETTESAEARREKVQKALDALYKGKKGKDGSPCQLGPHCWIKELGMDKLVFQKEGVAYGANYTVDDATGQVRIVDPVPVESVYVQVGQGGHVAEEQVEEA